MTDTPDWVDEKAWEIVNLADGIGNPTSTRFRIAQALRDLAAEKDKEIDRLKAELAETIAAFPLGAVKAERARCATIAETTEREGFGGGAYNEAGRDIAAAIRGQTDD